MLCHHCGRPIKNNSRSCPSCGAKVVQYQAYHREQPGREQPDREQVNRKQTVKEQPYREHLDRGQPDRKYLNREPVHTELPGWPGQAAASGYPDPLRKRKTRLVFFILGGIALAAAVILAGYMLLKGEGTPVEVIESTDPDVMEVSALIQTLSGDGYEMQYDAGVWRPETIGSYNGLVYQADGSQMAVIGSNVVPPLILSFADFSKEGTGKSLYSALELAVPQYIPEGYSAAGGTGTFLELKQGIYYAAMNFKNDEGGTGKLFAIVSQKDKANILIVIRSADQAKAAAFEADAMKILDSIVLSK